MAKIKVLNLYAGIGGNRKLWPNDEIEVTAIEIDPRVSKVYASLYPDDTVIVADAHSYLLEHYEKYDFIWASPPCPSHSHIRKELAVEAKKQNKPIYPDMKLYEEILFLMGYYKGKWVVENVISWYKPLIRPYEVGHHYFWSNVPLTEVMKNFRNHLGSIEELEETKGFDLSSYEGIDKREALRNCVEPDLGLHIFNMVVKEKQKVLTI